MEGRFWLRATLCAIGACTGCSRIPPAKEPQGQGPYLEEPAAVIGRGVVALPGGPGRVFVAWRLLRADPESVSFDVYRRNLDNANGRLLLRSRTRHTFFIDHSVKHEGRYEYVIRPSTDGKEGEPSGHATVTASPTAPAALVFDVGQDYGFAQVVTGDLNGDGEPEVVIAYAKGRRVDPYQKAWQKSEGTIKVAAFLRTGERLWTKDLGPGIESGPAYAPMIVWDIDGDGRAEVLLKTNKSGNRLDYHHEYLTVVDGETGRTRREAEWPSTEGLPDDYNSNSRNYLAIAHLDGKNPYIIAARGLYMTQKIWAYDRDLHRLWERRIGNDLYSPQTWRDRWRRFWASDAKAERLWSRITGKGRPARKDLDRASHSLPIADLDDDGKEEILWGEHCIGEGGKDKWVVEDHTPYLGHPDIVFAAHVLPNHPGKQVYYVREGWSGRKSDRIGMLLVDSKGRTLWAHWGYTHVDGGWVAKVDARQEGLQAFGYDIEGKEWTPGTAALRNVSPILWTADGQRLSTPPGSWVLSFPVDWDGDGVREVADSNGEVQRYNGPVIASLGANLLWGADLLGDQREEVVAAPGHGRVYIYFNTDSVAIAPRITPLADRQYKNDLSRTAMQANVIPTEGDPIPVRSGLIAHLPR